jgi:hypothetical protein
MNGMLQKGDRKAGSALDPDESCDDDGDEEPVVTNGKIPA